MPTCSFAKPGGCFDLEASSGSPPQGLAAGGLLCSPRRGDHFIESLFTCVDRPRSLLARLRDAFNGPRHHLWLYDEASLSSLLTRHGFHNATAPEATRGPEFVGKDGGIDLCGSHPLRAGSAG